jgi:hypothetical protein
MTASDRKKENAVAVEALATVPDSEVVRLIRADALSREDLESEPIRDLIAREVRSGAMRSDEQLQASLAETMRSVEGDVWVFGYGSLMWNPIFSVAERRVVRISGYHRSFCLRSAMDEPWRRSARIQSRQCDAEECPVPIRRSRPASGMAWPCRAANC